MMGINYWQSFQEEAFYHIYSRSINQEKLFKSHENYRFFLKQWAKYLAPYFDTYAYALIPNHFHFLVKVRPIDEGFLACAKQEQTRRSEKFIAEKVGINEFLEDQMKRFLGSYCAAFNKQEDRTGSLFQKRFKRVQINNEVQLLYMIAYQHHNPIHHQLAKDFESWPYTSYAAIGSNSPTNICRNAVLKLICRRLTKRANGSIPRIS